MPMERSTNATSAHISQEQHDAYRAKGVEDGGYHKTWQGAMDTDHMERERLRANRSEYEGSDLEKEDKEKAEKKEKIMACFTRYDMDNDDHLSVREFGRIFVDCGMSRGDAEKLFKAVDKNKDKQISIKEFVNWLFKDVGDMQPIRDHCQAAVKPGDAIKEFFQYLKWLNTSNSPRAQAKKDSMFGGDGFDMEELFKKMDSNHNGEVSMQEFVTALQSMGHKIDPKMMQKVFGMIDEARANSKNLVDEKGEILMMKDGSMNMQEFEKEWNAFM